MTSTYTPQATFVYAVCQLGAEPALKAEVARLHPQWRFAFSRPGLVTWKAPKAVAVDVQLGAVLARCSGLSLGRAATAAETAALIQGALGDAAFALHVFERDRHKPGEEPPGDSYGALADQVWQGLLDTKLRAHPRDRALQAGDLVVDIAVAPDEPWLVGIHQHGPGRSVFPGGRPSLLLPAQAPSRAWLKLEEGLVFSGLPIKPGEVALEIGSAPGGASQALLQRGLQVVGVDPAEMDPTVASHPSFTHVQVKLGDLRREQLPKRVDWLFVDVNLAPAVALHQLRRIVSTLKTTLKGGVITLKLNSWSMAAEIPAFLKRLQAMGFSEVRATQLAHNRQEICVALRRKRPR
ncbi:MAG TPA: SAM-dependent methyltransferase [Polyangiaceae bacterium]|nr:SAM-dependent methyltransferase [Polyangiaceae bacterium]